MKTLRNKTSILRNSRNKGKVVVRRHSANDAVIDEQVINNDELENKTIEEIAQDLPLAEDTTVSVSEMPNGDEVIEIPEGAELSSGETIEESLEQNCSSKRNTRRNSAKCSLRVRRMSRTKFVVRNTDGTEDVIEDPELGNASIEDIANELPAKSVDIVDNDTLEVAPEDLDIDDSYGPTQMSKQNSAKKKIIKIRK